MYLTITCKYEAESEKELKEELGSIFQQMQAHTSALKKKGLFGIPSKVEIRHLIIGETIRVPQEPRKPKKAKEEEVVVPAGPVIS